LVAQIIKIVLDVLKPREPPLHEFASKLVSMHGVEHVGISLGEIDQNTESVKVTLEGNEILMDSVRKHLEGLGAAIHSIDEVSVVRRKPTPTH